MDLKSNLAVFCQTNPHVEGNMMVMLMLLPAIATDDDVAAATATIAGDVCSVGDQDAAAGAA